MSDYQLCYTGDQNIAIKKQKRNWQVLGLANRTTESL